MKNRASCTLLAAKFHANNLIDRISLHLDLMTSLKTHISTDNMHQVRFMVIIVLYIVLQALCTLLLKSTSQTNSKNPKIAHANCYQIPLLIFFYDESMVL